MFGKNIPQAPAPVCQSYSRRLSQEHVHPRALALCNNTVFLLNRVVHKLRNKPKFTKPHEKTNVCSLWANLHGAPPRKQTSFNSGKLITLGRALCLGHCCFALSTQILSLDSNLCVTGQQCTNPLYSLHNLFVDYCYPHCTKVGLKKSIFQLAFQ